MLEGVRERLHIRPDKEPDKRTVYDLHVANSIEINTQADKLPEKVNINDPRLVELVAGLHKLNINPVKEPIPLDRIGGSKKTSRVVVDIDSLTPGSEPTEYSVPIPVDLFVAAPEISDWRRGRRSPKNGRRSSSIIREYSRLSAKNCSANSRRHGIYARRRVNFRRSIRRWCTPSMRSQTPRRQ